MDAVKIAVCRTQEDAQVACLRLRQDGFECDEPEQQASFVYWDATQANPSDPELIFRNHFVVIGRRRRALG